jgi:hypothetical protein
MITTTITIVIMSMSGCTVAIVTEFSKRKNFVVDIFLFLKYSTSKMSFIYQKDFFYCTKTFLLRWHSFNRRRKKNNLELINLTVD